jgi:transcriptional regulator GlxA family with amidase domain
VAQRRTVFVIFDGFQPLDMVGPHEVFSCAAGLGGAYVCEVVAARAGLVRSGSGLSPRHLQRRFTAEVGTPPAAYVERVRIEAAQRALTGTDDPVDTIARRCGFGTAETLRRAFHRHARIAPADYRTRFRSTRELT